MVRQRFEKRKSEASTTPGNFSEAGILEGNRSAEISGRSSDAPTLRTPRGVAAPERKKPNSSEDGKGKSDGENSSKSDFSEGTNWASGGQFGESYDGLLMAFFAPAICTLLSYVTSAEMAVNMAASGLKPHLFGSLLPACFEDPSTCATNIWQTIVISAMPTWEAARFVLGFMLLAFVFEFLPGKVECGPETLTGHIPRYVVNGVKHFVLFSIIFFCGSNLCPLWDGLYDFGIFFDLFVPALAFLNVFGFAFAFFLMLKGRFFPSTQDASSSGSFVMDFMWGMELYPRLHLIPKKFVDSSKFSEYFHGWDLKRFINSRFSMIFWMLAGLSFAYRSYTLHRGAIDYGLLFSAISQYLYLAKFFWWEMGYMRSIDIIVDRAGFEIQWGCLVWVPAVYTIHTRFLVVNPSGLSFSTALSLFIVSMLGVVFNYLADRERDVFRASNGKALVWGRPAEYIEAEYSVIDRNTGKTTTKKSLLLCSGFWGVARHFQYSFELTAAWMWGMLANPFVNGVIPLGYCTFLTWLLIKRARRDHERCERKYGKYWQEYCKLVPWKILPGVY